MRRLDLIDYKSKGRPLNYGGGIRELKIKKEIIPLPFPAYYIPTLILAFGGLADSIYLAVSHYRVYTDIGYSSFCAISKSINCDTVSQSPYSILLNVPVPVWGIWGYLVFTLILIKAWTQRRRAKDGWALLQVLALGFNLYSIVLAVISTYFINSYCIMCILSYGINLLLLFYTWLIRRRFKLPPLSAGLRRDLRLCWQSSTARWSGGILAAAALVGFVFFPPYWKLTTSMPPTGTLSSGLTKEGDPWIGATDPELKIIEYTDYLCFQCRKMHRYLRQLVVRHPDRIRLVHRHFPMDSEVNAIVKEPLHVGSGKMALIALYAAEQGKFWEMNDALYATAAKHAEIDLKALAAKTGLDLPGMRSALTGRTDLLKKLAKDIGSGFKLEITGTPAYAIDGELFQGNIPPEKLKRHL